MGIAIFNQNQTHAERLTAALASVVAHLDLDDGHDLCIVASPAGDSLGDHYLPADAVVGTRLRDRLKHWGVPSPDGHREFIFLRHKPLVDQMTRDFLHEYRHHWQHVVLPPATVRQARSHNWVARCHRCRSRLPAGYLPAETDAEVFSYHMTRRLLRSQRRVDILFGSQLENSAFFEHDLSSLDIVDGPRVKAEVEAFSKAIAPLMAHHPISDHLASARDHQTTLA